MAWSCRYRNITILTYFFCKLETLSANFLVGVWSQERMVCYLFCYTHHFTGSVFFSSPPPPIPFMIFSLWMTFFTFLFTLWQKLRAWKESWPASLVLLYQLLCQTGRYYFLLYSVSEWCKNKMGIDIELPNFCDWWLAFARCFLLGFYFIILCFLVLNSCLASILLGSQFYLGMWILGTGKSFMCLAHKPSLSLTGGPHACGAYPVSERDFSCAWDTSSLGTMV